MDKYCPRELSTNQALGDLALLILPLGWVCAAVAKANVPKVRWDKIILKMCGGKKNKTIAQVLVSANWSCLVSKLF